MKTGITKRLWWAIAIAALVILTTTAVWAQATRRIVGTPRNDVLRGTARADVLEGRGGNDRLLGLAAKDLLIGGPGRDILVGGPGADTLRCGSGKDIARADASDTVRADCEVVTGLPSPAPPPPPPPPPPSPPPSARAQPGKYCGFTDQGPGICVTVAPDSSRVTTYNLGAVVDCVSGKGTFTFVTFGPGPIQADLTFSRAADETRPDRNEVKNISVSWEIGGKFDTNGNVTGTFFLKRASFDKNGTHFDCTSTPTGWRAKLGT
jgi:RTX calcium-binding nonapeptide repeat (4 copies)